MNVPLILASGSAIRRQVLAAAGVGILVVRPSFDEEAAKEDLRRRGLPIAQQALSLAVGKAKSVSQSRPGLVIGADQMLALEGEAFDKPKSMEEARTALKRLRGRPHQLIGGLCVASGQDVLWTHTESVTLHMRAFSDAFLEEYLRAGGEALLSSVGAYQVESLGAQLFDAIEGDYFSVLGMPLFPLLGFLRSMSALPT